MIFDITHKTHYRYTQPVAQSQHLVHLAPRRDTRQTVLRHGMIIDPAPAMRYDGADAFGNPVSILDIEEPHKEFVLNARSTIETAAPAAFDFAASTPWDALDRALYPAGGDIDLGIVQYRCPSRLTGPTLALRDYARPSFAPGRPVLEAAHDLTRRIFAEFSFDATATDVSTPIAEVLRQRRGVCQDFAHLALAVLRAHRVPARYVSGYILTLPPPGQPKLQGSDASHAWISVWAPETGWRDFDPTNGLVVGDEHILIAHGRDYADVCPVSGVIVGGGHHTVSVGVDVTKVG
jgi:transglutaminase-like putative cysteine protease